MVTMIRDIFDELIEEACKGKVLIDGEEWPIGFDTIIFTDNKDISYRNDRNLSCLVIKNEDEFLNLREYYGCYTFICFIFKYIY